MIKPIVIYGSGGMGREVKTLIDHINEKEPAWEVLGFADDAVTPGTIICSGLKVLGGREYLTANNVHTVIAMGSPSLRYEVVNNLKNTNVQFATLIHPSVIMGDRKTIKTGTGSIICAGCILTTDINIGDHVLINLACTVGHDVSIDSFASVMPGVNISGGVKVGLAAFIGSGSTIINEKKLGEFSITGAGSVIIRDVPPNAKVAGVPGRVITAS